MSREEKDELMKQKLQEEMWSDDYSDQVYALTMGTWKTVLMTVFMLYDIVLSYYYPDNNLFAKNFLVFSPDKTIIQSLKEIKDFDYTNVIPSEYTNALLQIKYHYLEDTKQQLSLQDGSNYNIIITNSQKIIVKTRKGAVWDAKKMLFGDEREREQHQVENQRLLSLKKLSNLSIFIDEAHHSFGKDLDGEIKKTKETVNRLHENQTITNCINMTGTPYVNGQMIPSVVYYYGLKQWIEDWILKEANILEFWEVKDDEFLILVLENFRKEYASYSSEWKKSKIAIYTASIAELREVREKLEWYICKKLWIPTNCIVENHQEASKQEQSEFLILDTPQSNKQIILLVNKGTEWRNCKSLFATALYRKPPAIFTLQSTTRCLRSIGDNNKKATIFLSTENYKILDKELQQNFGITIWDMQGSDKKIQPITCTVQKRKEIAVQKIVKEIIASQLSSYDDIVIDFARFKAREVYYHIKTIEKDGDSVVYKEWQKDSELISKEMLGMTYSRYEILGIINRYTHLPFDGIKIILSKLWNPQELIDKINKENGLLWYIIDEICNQYYQYEEQERNVIEILHIVKKDIGTFTFDVDSDKLSKRPKLLVYQEECNKDNRLWFHLNPYNFDSSDEVELFSYIREKLADDEHIQDVYFTGSNTEKMSDFFFEYTIYENEKPSIKRYFPDLLVEVRKSDESKKYVVIEVKWSDKRSDYEQAKKLYDQGQRKITNEVFAKEIGFKEFTECNKEFEYRLVFDAKIPSKQSDLIKSIV